MGWRSFWLLALGGLLLCLQCQAQDGRAAVKPAFLDSSSLGVKYCPLKGELGNITVTLHVWIRLGPGTAHNTLRAAGFAVLHSPDSATASSHTIQLAHGEALQYLSDHFYLRSLYSGQLYNLTVSIPGRNQGHQAVSGSLLNHPIAFWGNWTLHEVDTANRDYELRAHGLSWYCTVMPAASIFTQSSLVEVKSTGAVPQPLPPIMASSSLGPATKVWIMLQPAHGMRPTTFAALLRHHYSWHKQLGISGYIVYAQDLVHGILTQPFVQELVARELLHIVFWDDIGRYETAPFEGRRHCLLLQAIMNNHAILAAWGTDTLLFMPDIDEYLVTPRPTTLLEVFKLAAHHSANTAAVTVERRDTRCRDGAPPECCRNGIAHRVQWKAISPEDVELGRRPHPFTYLVVTKPSMESHRIWPKLIVDPNLTHGVVVHTVTYTLPGSLVAAADPSAALLAHVAEMHTIRPGYNIDTDAMQMKSEDGVDWQWPASKLQQPAHV